MLRTILRAAGLWTDPNPMGSDKPEGALREATNVVIRRRGVVEPRPGFADHDPGQPSLPSSSSTGRALFALGGVLYLLYQTSSNVWKLWSYSDGDQAQPWSSDASAFATGELHGASLANAWYLTSREGLWRIPAPEDNTTGQDPAAAGFPRAVAGTTDLLSTGATWLGANESVAYRVVYVTRASGARGLLCGIPALLLGEQRRSGPSGGAHHPACGRVGRWRRAAHLPVEHPDLDRCRARR